MCPFPSPSGAISVTIAYGVSQINAGESEQRMYFEKYQDARKEWRWRLKAANHEIIGVASEGYTTEASCDHSINLVKSTDKNTEVKVTDS